MNSMDAGKVEVIQGSVPYIADPLAVFSNLTDHGLRKHTLLLESVEVDTKRHTKSLLLLNAALVIRCNANTVTIDALTVNGKSLLPYLSQRIPSKVHQYLTTDKLLLVFPGIPEGLDEEQRLKALTPIQVLRTLVEDLQSDSTERDAVFLGGVFSYDMIASFEDLPEVSEGVNPCSDMVFYLSETLLVVDHINEKCRLQHTVFGGLNYQAASKEGTERLSVYEQQIRCNDTQLSINEYPVESNTVRISVSDEEFCQQVEKLKKNIIAGDVFQVVPSRCFSIQCADSFLSYRQLKTLNPSPYMFYLNDPQFVLFGASPESALNFNAQSREVSVYPIAGTRKRGKNEHGIIDPDFDSRIELELRTDQKEVAEHLMLVDLARNDIARISTTGSRHVANLLKVDRYSHVMHLVSRVAGTLRDDLDAMHAYQASMNMGTLVGAPKIRAAELIRETEKTRRGSYGGAIGYINGWGDMDTCIVIRSACVVNGVAHIQAGAGVVFDSDPMSEADETRSKAQAVIQAVQMANDIVHNNYKMTAADLPMML